MLSRLIRWYGAAMLMLDWAPVAAFAQDEEKTYSDARLEGYSEAVSLEGGSSALTWILLIILTVVALGGMFKNAKRTHLD